MFKYFLEFKKTLYVLKRENIAVGCPWRNKACGTACALFDIKKTPKAKKVKVVLACTSPTTEYPIDEIIYPNEEKE